MQGSEKHPPPVVLGAPPLFSQPTIIPSIPAFLFQHLGYKNHEFSKSLKNHTERKSRN